MRLHTKTLFADLSDRTITYYKKTTIIQYMFWHITKLNRDIRGFTVSLGPRFEITTKKRD